MDLPADEDDEEPALIAAALAGGAADFEPLVRRFGLRVYAVAFAVLGDRTEAEDAAQDTFLRAYRQRGRLREPERFAPWLLSIARRQALDRLRRRRFVPLPDDAETLADDAATPDELLDAAENHARLRAVLATLPERHRVALTLRYLEGHDCRTVESAMALSNGALRGVLGRALAAMRAGLRLRPQRITH